MMLRPLGLRFSVIKEIEHDPEWIYARDSCELGASRVCRVRNMTLWLYQQDVPYDLSAVFQLDCQNPWSSEICSASSSVSSC